LCPPGHYAAFTSVWNNEALFLRLSPKKKKKTWLPFVFAQDQSVTFLSCSFFDHGLLESPLFFFLVMDFWKVHLFF
jgi:hypothetical protein